jgi:formiminotetrahydrofolate cyclodeaminase
MVAAMSRGKKAYAQHEAVLSEAIAKLAALREDLKAAIDADAASYNAVMKAYKAARDAGDDGIALGRNSVNAALRQAAGVPLLVAERSAQVARIAESLRPISSPMMASDLTTAVALAAAAITGALANVDINLSSIEAPTAEDEAFVTETRARAAKLR